MTQKITIQIPGLDNPISIESTDVYSDRFTLGNRIQATANYAIAKALMASTCVKLKIDDSKREKIIKRLQPYIAEISQELHKIYTIYVDALKIFKKYDIVKKLREVYNDDFKVKQYNTSPLNEPEFVTEFTNGIAFDIQKILKKKTPENAYSFDQAIIAFNEEKVFADVTEEQEKSGKFDFLKHENMYFLRCKKICKILNDILKENSHGRVKLDYSRSDDHEGYISIVIRYGLSKKLLGKLLIASKG
jgi:hypothetical protein